MNITPRPSMTRRGITRATLLVIVMVIAAMVVLALAADKWVSRQRRERRVTRPRSEKFHRLELYFDGFPDGPQATWKATGPHSNVRPVDYTSPETCRKCHPKNHRSWLDHSHRKMNLRADETSVVGDFSGGEAIEYLGGTARFERDGGRFSMKLTRDGTSRTYEITQTIGSRFFQYYVGRLVEGPEPDEHPMRQTEFVLPFGYWLDEQQWVPTVHVSEEVPDGEREDPFEVPAKATNGKDFYAYSQFCASCHSTFAMGELLLRNPPRLGRYTPVRLHWSMFDYLVDALPDLWPEGQESFDLTDQDLMLVMVELQKRGAPEHAVTMGISCGACHFGAREHAEERMKKPRFFPSSPYLFVETNEQKIDFGRTARNVNWACARCHTGSRPLYAAGMSTWNSIEFTDALLGNCFSKLTCVHCHEPHTGIGPRWTRPAARDDAVCVACHKQYADSQLLAEHTHHKVDSTGSHCMNCHMPRINEGLQDLVRTHQIFSPTEPTMIDANEPNACNLCHTDKGIDWTIEYLSEWYPTRFNEGSIKFTYPDRKQPVPLGWLKSERESVRLVGADCLFRTEAKWALEPLLEVLDDRYLINRQFGSRGFEKLFGVKLSDYGYRFTMMPEERRAPLAKLKAGLVGSGTSR